MFLLIVTVVFAAVAVEQVESRHSYYDQVDSYYEQVTRGVARGLLGGLLGGC